MGSSASPNDLLKQVLDNEQLAPIDGCMDPSRQFDVRELKALLATSGPIAFAWKPAGNPRLAALPKRNHWAVIIDADPATDTIVYHNPVAARLENSEMTLEEFNRQRFREHDHTLLQRRMPGGGAKDPGFVTWRQMTVRPSSKDPAHFLCGPVPYLAAQQGQSAQAAFATVGSLAGPGGPASAPARLQEGLLALGDDVRLAQMVDEAGLSPVPEGADAAHVHDAQSLKECLLAAGPIAFAWRPEYIPDFKDEPLRHQWSVVVDVDPATNSLVYHDPFRGRQNCVMTLSEFNRQLFRGHDNVMLQRRLPATLD